MDQHFDGSDAHLLVACPKCGRQWLPPCEQTICIERHGECIPCRFVPAGGEINKHGSGEGTKEEIDAISAAAKVGAGETAHDWKCVSPGEYDTLYECAKCGAKHMEQADRLGSERPQFGCTHNVGIQRASPASGEAPLE